MDKIIIRDLEVFYRIGVPEAERQRAQRLLISVEVERSFAQAQSSDELETTTDYGAIVAALLRFGDEREWQLIETLGNDIAQWILSEFKPDRVTVEIKKFIIPEARYVAVRLTRPV